MSAPINNQFAGGYQINEKEGKLNEFGSSIETDTSPMQNLEGEELKADGGGMYASFEAPRNNNTRLSGEMDEEGNPDDILGELDNIELDTIHDNTQTEEKTLKEEGEVATEELKSNLEVHSEHPAYPMLDNFNTTERQFSQPEITEEVFLGITEGLSNEGGLDLQELQNNIKKANIDDKDLQKNLMNYMRKTIALNPKRLLEADGEIQEFPEEFKQVSLLDNPEDPVNQLIATNYIRFPKGVEGNPNFEQDIHTACKTAANCLIAGKEITRNEGFEIAMKEIQSTNLETQLHGLRYLNKETQTTQGQHGKKQQEKGKRLNDDRIANNNAAEAFQEIQSIKTAESIKEKQARLNQKNENDKKLAESSLQPKGGEIYAGSELEVGGEGIKVT